MTAQDEPVPLSRTALDLFRWQIPGRPMPMLRRLLRATILVLSTVVVLCRPTEVGAVTLREELLQLLKTHPRLHAEQNRVGSAKAQVRRAFADFLPRLVFDGDFGREYIDSPTQPAASNLTRQKTTLSLTQNVFNGFRSWENHSAANLRETVARHRLNATQQLLLLEGITAYYEALRQARLVEIARKNERVIKEQLDLEDERVRRGAGTAIDRLFAKTRLQLARERTVQLAGTFAQARARYRQVFGHDPIIGTMNDPDLDLSALPSEIEEAAEVSAGSNPALLASDGEARVADKIVRAARGGFFPRIDIVAQVNREQGVDAVNGERKDWSVLLRATWELFSGFATSANVASAAREKAAARDTYLFNRRKIDEELRTAWHQLTTARLRVKLLANAVSIAGEVFQARKRRRDAGRETAVNVLDAQTELFSARQNHIAARFDAEVAAFRVLFTMGRLTPTTLGLSGP